MFPIWTVPDRTHEILNSWRSGFISLFFPEKCPFCRTLVTSSGEEKTGLCRDCVEAVEWITTPYCSRCGKPFPKGATAHLCSDCLQEKHAFDQGRAAVFYEGLMAEAIQRFKYRGDIKLTAPLSRLWEKMDLEDLSFEAIIPVPLHPARLRKRGFNQALLLGKILGRTTNKRVIPRALRRIRNTIPQVQLGHSERERNVRGAFAVSRQQEIKDKNLLLVDDVFTTGATVNECARVLKKSGARQVSVLTLARVGGR